MYDEPFNSIFYILSECRARSSKKTFARVKIHCFLRRIFTNEFSHSWRECSANMTFQIFNKVFRKFWRIFHEILFHMLRIQTVFTSFAKSNFGTKIPDLDPSPSKPNKSDPNTAKPLESWQHWIRISHFYVYSITWHKYFKTENLQITAFKINLFFRNIHLKLSKIFFKLKKFELKWFLW